MYPQPLSSATDHIKRSAHLVTTATETAAYFGRCAREHRPVRIELDNALDRAVSARCPLCEDEHVFERLVILESSENCADSCRHAWSPECRCGCGGINHGNIWATVVGTKEVPERELLAAIIAYRQHMIAVLTRQEQKEQDEMAARAEAFENWASSNEAFYFRVMAEPCGPDDPRPNPFLQHIQRLLDSTEIPTDPQILMTRQILADRLADIV